MLVIYLLLLLNVAHIIFILILLVCKLHLYLLLLFSTTYIIFLSILLLACELPFILATYYLYYAYLCFTFSL